MEPKVSWRRTVENEIKAMGFTWGEVEMAWIRTLRFYSSLSIF